MHMLKEHAMHGIMIQNVEHEVYPSKVIGLKR